MLTQYLAMQGETEQNSLCASETVLPVIVAALLQNLIGQGESSDNMVRINAAISSNDDHRLDYVLEQTPNHSFHEMIEFDKQFLPLVFGR